MFDISFTELMAISVVALLVIGPEKLPKVARMAGAFTARIQKMVSQVKEEVNREVRFEELQNLQQEMAEASNDIKQGFNQEADDVRSILEDEQPEKPKRKPRAKSTKSKAVAASKPKTKRAVRKKTTAKKSTTSS